MPNTYKGNGSRCQASTNTPEATPYTGAVAQAGPPAGGDGSMASPEDPCPICPPSQCCSADIGNGPGGPDGPGIGGGLPPLLVI
jgi:hypothetical protein